MKFGENIYYEKDSDPVVHFNEKQIMIDESYKYSTKNPLYNLIASLTYNLVALPSAFVVYKLLKKIKFHNAKILKNQNDGYFVYCNHTNHLGDGFCPALLCFPKQPKIIVNPVNVSIPFIGKFTKMWGALPLPSNISATKNFNNAIEDSLSKKTPIIIYPEAHLWPYYTKIRNFSASSFRYPIKYNKPVFTFTTIYKLKKVGKKPKVEIFVDGPFYADKSLNEKQAQQKLRDDVHKILTKRSSLSNYEYVNYIKQEKK